MLLVPAESAGNNRCRGPVLAWGRSDRHWGMRSADVDPWADHLLLPEFPTPPLNHATRLMYYEVSRPSLGAAVSKVTQIPRY